jgi:hypothetical protein
MFRAHRIGRRLPLLAVLALVLALACAGAAQAAGFGMLGRFGAPGVEPGQLTAPHENEEGELFEPWHVIGVNPENNDVYVLEEDEAPAEPHEEEVVRSFRLQELTEPGAPLAEAHFKYTQDKAEIHEPEQDYISGIAVDPVSKRLYFLVTESRGTGVVAEAEAAAAALFAYKTEPNSKKELEPAPGTSKEGELVPPSKLEPNSQPKNKEPSKALLQPHGITVDTKTGEVIVLGHDDECIPGSKSHPCEGEEDELKKPEDHYVLERFTEAGELHERFVDTSDLFKPTQPGSQEYKAPFSPVMVPGPKGAESVLAGHTIETPTSPSEATFDRFPASGEPGEVELESGIGGTAPNGFEEPGGIDIGGTLASGLNASGEHVIYALTSIDNEEKAGEIENGVAVLELSAETLSPIGWTGGQLAAVAKEDECVLAPGALEQEQLQIAAGKEGKIFVLVPEYLSGGEEGGITFPSEDSIIELGPGGKGCPQASTGEISVEVAKKKVAPGKPVPLKTPVRFESLIKQGDALSTTWKIENEATHTVVFEETKKTGEFQAPALTYEFKAEAKPGPYKVMETIKTDNLGTPELTPAPRTVSVEAPLTAPAPESVTVKAGELAKFTVKPSAVGVKVQWYVKKPGGSFEKDTEDKNFLSETLEVLATKAKNGNEYRAEVEETGTHEVVTSEPAKLTVETAKPKVTGQPASVSVTAGANATFTAAASGAPAPAIQWEVSTDGGGSWTAVPGATLTTLTVTATTTAENGYLYRATFTNELGSEASSAATLSVASPPPPPPPPPGEHGVEPSKTVAPRATIAGAGLTVTAAGTVTIKVSCPAGATTCIGTLTLKTLTAVSASARTAKSKKPKKAILTLASGSFSVGGGATKSVTLHLSKAALQLLGRSHQLSAKATVESHDPANEKATTTAVVTLHPAPAKHKKKH